MDVVDHRERVIKDLRHLVAKWRYVGHQVARKNAAGADPARKIHDIEPQDVIHDRVVPGVETDSAAITWSASVEIGVREHEGGNVVLRNVAVFCPTNDCARIAQVDRWREQSVKKWYEVNQHETAAGAVGLQRKLVGAADQRHGVGLLRRLRSRR